MERKEFLFEYPPELVAQDPPQERDASRMMVLDRKSRKISHASFRDFPSFFQPGDLILLNNTKVLPARLWAKKPTGGKVEVLLVREGDSHTWECLIRSMKGLRDGSEILFSWKGRAVPAVLRIGEDRTKRLQFPPDASVHELMEEEGAAPLPPYIKRKEARSEDLERYQTVFAERKGAIAAPTASLHFTPGILRTLTDRGVTICYVTLHVGPGTFEPLESERVEDHRMQAELYEIPPDVVKSIKQAKKEGRPVTAVGTTTVRAVESYFQNPPSLSDSANSIEFAAHRSKASACHPLSKGDKGGFLQTNLFITPGCRFQIVDRFLTNFHQPSSTPLLLTCAFAGKDFLFEAYGQAIEKKYRLFSYGDCMLIL
jgi:S-adenosylmethionine:tRNA ribosyltransferase-isomerase